MRTTLSSLLFFAIAPTLGAQSGSIDTATAALYFREVATLGKADAGRLWGRSVNGLMMFVDPSTGQIVANAKDSAGLLTSAGDLWVGKLPPEISPANTAQRVGGRLWSMIMWPLSDSRYARDRLLMHESFHRIQDSLGLPAFSPQNAHLATADGRIWMRLEWRALTEALLRSGQSRRQALADALTFRARRQSIAPNAADEERQLELNEGLAEYTGLVLSGLPRSALYDRAAVSLAQTENQDSFSRSFAYASGPAYGLLLDDMKPSWRKSLTSSSNIAELARLAYGIPRVAPANAEGLVTRYGGSRMVAAERAREKDRIAREAALRTQFTSGPRLKLPSLSKFSFAFDPNGTFPIAGLGTVYRGARITDEWGVLEADGDVLIARGDDPFRGAVVANPVVAEGNVHGDGWKLTLAPGWTVTQGASPGEFLVAEKK